MTRYTALADDFYINMNLSTEMELPQGRDTVLHYFERIQKKYPSMRKFYCRDKRDFVLEEDKDRSQYRWATVENRRLCSGQVNPATIEEAMEQSEILMRMGAVPRNEVCLEIRRVMTWYRPLRQEVEGARFFEGLEIGTCSGSLLRTSLGTI
jgi:hypothetical protein